MSRLVASPFVAPVDHKEDPHAGDKGDKGQGFHRPFIAVEEGKSNQQHNGADDKAKIGVPNASS
jgi:hypothetical protein